MLRAFLFSVNRSQRGNSRERLQDLYQFFAAIDAIYTDVRKLPVGTLRGLMKARGAFPRILSGRQSKSGEPARIM